MAWEVIGRQCRSPSLDRWTYGQRYGIRVTSLLIYLSQFSAILWSQGKLITFGEKCSVSEWKKGPVVKAWGQMGKSLTEQSGNRVWGGVLAWRRDVGLQKEVAIWSWMPNYCKPRSLSLGQGRERNQKGTRNSFPTLTPRRDLAIKPGSERPIL